MTSNQARASLAASTWRKARASQGANACVEVAHTAGHVGIRDTKLNQPFTMLTVDSRAWAAFVDGFHGCSPEDG